MAKYLATKSTTKCHCGVDLRIEELVVVNSDISTNYSCPNCEFILMCIMAPYKPEMGVVNFKVTT